jgi:hypothetical protein
MKTASPRNVKPAAHGLRASHTRAARAIRRRFVAVIDSWAASRRLRAFTFDESDRIASPDDEIDFAAGNDVPAGEDGIPFQPQQRRRDRFGSEAEKMRLPSARRPFVRASGAHLEPASSSARA